jgi:hypothetical protein
MGRGVIRIFRKDRIYPQYSKMPPMESKGDSIQGGLFDSCQTASIGEQDIS